MIGGPPALLSSRARVDGYRAARDAAGIALDPDLIRWGNFEMSGGYREAQALLRAPSGPTAIFAGNDTQAMGVLRAAHEFGLRVPEDLSLVGFDDIPLAEWSSPPLTTVRQPLQEMAALAVRRVLEMQGEEHRDSRRVELGTELVVRASTAPPRPRGR